MSEGGTMFDANARATILDEWHAQVLGTYSEQVAHDLAAGADSFHNPAGHTLRDSLAVLVDAVVAGDGHAAVGHALADLVRLRAVQDFTAAQAVGFLLALKPIVRRRVTAVTPCATGCGETLADLPYDDRIDRLMLLAFDLYVQCREKLAEIKVNEAKRQTWLLDHLSPG